MNMYGFLCCISFGSFIFLLLDSYNYITKYYKYVGGYPSTIFETIITLVKTLVMLFLIIPYTMTMFIDIFCHDFYINEVDKAMAKNLNWRKREP